MREWKVTDGYKVKADELSWEELKNATENVIEEKRKSHRIVVLDGYGLNPGDLSWEGIERMGEFTVYDRTSVDEIVSRAAFGRHRSHKQDSIERNHIGATTSFTLHRCISHWV